jgi:hypothetical protein
MCQAENIGQVNAINIAWKMVNGFYMKGFIGRLD